MKKSAFPRSALWAGVMLPALLTACGGGNDPPTPLTLKEAVGATIASCTGLASSFTYPNTSITAASVVAAGALTVGGTPIAEHCLITGKMYERVSPVDGQTYAIQFEMRMPTAWNGRFIYQANGGTDGAVSSALGAPNGTSGLTTPAQLTNGLSTGAAVISSDAGHTLAQAKFGLDPQARLDYGYQAVPKLTPMAKQLVAAAYGKAPDRSYIVGTSNGGRHVMVAAARTPDMFDGFLAAAPGFHLPKAAAAQLYGAQQWAPLATQPATLTNLETALPIAERQLISRAILAKCDALDGASDDMVQDVDACRTAFDIQRDVPTCTSTRDGTCLTAAQKTAIAAVYAGPRNSQGATLYATFPFDTGIASTGWADWKFRNSVGSSRDPVAVGYIFSTPPRQDIPDTLAFALGYNFDTDYPLMFATNTTYTESGWSFMTPPNETSLMTLRNRGAKLIVIHGNSDPVFSVDDTKAWYDNLNAQFGGAAGIFARFFRIPGMGHSRGGPATDQFDSFGALVNWVERGSAPDRIVATGRGTGNAGGVNTELPVSWSAARTRPLCPYPQVARYNGSGSLELADSFTCR